MVPSSTIHIQETFICIRVPLTRTITLFVQAAFTHNILSVQRTLRSPRSDPLRALGIVPP